MSADDRLYALRDPCKNRSEDKGDICKDSVGGNTCISVQLKDQEIEYDNNDSEESSSTREETPRKQISAARFNDSRIFVI